MTTEDTKTNSSTESQHAVVSQVGRGVRPACWGFAMDFLGDPEAPVVEAYVTSLEAEIVRLRDVLEEVADGVDKWTSDGMAHIARKALGPNVEVSR